MPKHSLAGTYQACNLKDAGGERCTRPKRRAYLYRGGKVIEWNFGVAFADPNNRVSRFEGSFMRGDRKAS